MRVPPWLGHAAARLVGPFVGDVVITREEIAGLMRGLLDSDAEAAGPTVLTEWARAERATLGRRYASEVRRRTVRDRGRGVDWDSRGSRRRRSGGA